MSEVGRDVNSKLNIFYFSQQIIKELQWMQESF